MSYRLGLVAFLVTGLMALSITPISASDSQDAIPGQQAIDSAAHPFAMAPSSSAYWTAARMEAATPVPAPSAQPGLGPSTSRPASGAKASRWTADGAITKTIGRVFFRFGSDNVTCSASVVTAAIADLVVTAAHCVAPDGRTPGRNWVFVPGYRDGATPYGKWAARELTAAPGWVRSRGKDFNEDVGFARLRTQGGRHIADVVGSNGIAFNNVVGSSVSAFGYPAASPFNGSSLYFCSGQTRSDTTEPTSTDLGLGCTMNDGASGGPWMVDISPELGGVIVSVNSLGYDELPNVLFGPRFGASIAALYASVQIPAPADFNPAA